MIAILSKFVFSCGLVFGLHYGNDWLRDNLDYFEYSLVFMASLYYSFKLSQEVNYYYHQSFKVKSVFYQQDKENKKVNISKFDELSEKD